MQSFNIPSVPSANRAAIVAAKWSLIGGLVAAIISLVLHPHPLEAVPAAPIYLLCLLNGGGDLGAVLFVLFGGFVLYALYGLA